MSSWKKIGKSLKNMGGSLLGGGLGFLAGGPLGAGIGAMIGSGLDAQGAADRANDQEMKYWLMQQEYNSPANQVARLKEAGLNPNLFYSQGNTGNASSTPSVHTSSFNAGQMISAVSQMLSLKNLKVQNENLAAQTGAINAGTDEKIADTMLKKATLDFYNKHGYFPNQNAASVFMSEVGNAVEGFLPSAADALGHISGIASLKRAEDYRQMLRPENLTKEQRSQMMELGYVFDKNLGDWVKVDSNASHYFRSRR